MPFGICSSGLEPDVRARRSVPAFGAHLADLRQLAVEVRP